MPDQVHLQVARVPQGEPEPVALEISRAFVAALCFRAHNQMDLSEFPAFRS
jgi:hypothetical protein